MTKKTWSREQIKQKVEDILCEQLGVDPAEVTQDASLKDDLAMDSLDCVECVMSYEEEFGLEISDDDAEKMITVRDSVDYIARRLNAE